MMTVRRRWHGFVRTLAVALALLLSPLRAGAASADDAADARMQKGIELRRQGKDAEALAEFRKALDLRRTPRALAQVALAEQALGLWTRAEEDLVEALESKSDGWIKKNLSTLNRALAVVREHIGSLEVWGTPEGATVLVNTKSVGTLPLDKPIRSADESVLLTVRADGFLETTRTIKVPPGQVTRSHIELVRAPVAAATTPPPMGGGETAGATTPEPEPKGKGATPGPPSGPDTGGGATSGGSALRPVAWVLGAGAVGGLVLGVVETLAWKKNQDAFNNYAKPNPDDPSHPFTQYCNTTNLTPECKPLYDAYNKNVTLMIVGYAAGGALAIASTVLFVLSSGRGSDAPPARSAMTCAPDLGVRGFGCRLVF